MYLADKIGNLASNKDNLAVMFSGAIKLWMIQVCRLKEINKIPEYISDSPITNHLFSILFKPYYLWDIGLVKYQGRSIVLLQTMLCYYVYIWSVL